MSDATCAALNTCSLCAGNLLCKWCGADCVPSLNIAKCIIGQGLQCASTPTPTSTTPVPVGTTTPTPTPTGGGLLDGIIKGVTGTGTPTPTPAGGGLLGILNPGQLFDPQVGDFGSPQTEENCMRDAPEFKGVEPAPAAATAIGIVVLLACVLGPMACLWWSRRQRTSQYTGVEMSTWGGQGFEVKSGASRGSGGGSGSGLMKCSLCSLCCGLCVFTPLVIFALLLWPSAPVFEMCASGRNYDFGEILQEILPNLVQLRIQGNIEFQVAVYNPNRITFHVGDGQGAVTTTDGRAVAVGSLKETRLEFEGGSITDTTINIAFNPAFDVALGLASSFLTGEQITLNIRVTGTLAGEWGSAKTADYDFDETIVLDVTEAMKPTNKKPPQLCLCTGKDGNVFTGILGTAAGAK